MQNLYNYSQFMDQLNYNSMQVRQVLERHLAQQSQLLMQKMRAFNNYLIQSDNSSTVPESKSNTEKQQFFQEEPKLNQKLIRQECLQRYRAKKRLQMNRTLYGVRKEIADRRLRFNGQFLNSEEEQKILKVHRLVGNHYLRLKNNNLKIIGIKKATNMSKEKVLARLAKLMPEEIKKRIQNQQLLFQIL